MKWNLVAIPFPDRSNQISMTQHVHKNISRLKIYFKNQVDGYEYRLYADHEV